MSAAMVLAMNPMKDLCLECSIRQMFLRSSLTVSMTDLLRSSILSLSSISTFFMFFLMEVIRWTPSTNRSSVSFCPMYPFISVEFGSVQRTVWEILHKLRAVMGLRDEPYKLASRVEIDEGFFSSIQVENESPTKPGRGSVTGKPV